MPREATEGVGDEGVGIKMKDRTSINGSAFAKEAATGWGAWRAEGRILRTSKTVSTILVNASMIKAPSCASEPSGASAPTQNR